MKDSKKVTKLLLKRKALFELMQNLREQVLIINNELQGLEMIKESTDSPKPQNYIPNPFKGGGTFGNL